jgi:hypothetical protein
MNTVSLLKYLFVFSLFGWFFITLFSSPIEAAQSSNPDYTIETDNLSTDNPDPTKIPSLPNAPTPSSAPTLSISKYTITSTSDAFSFSLSQNAIDFGILSATNPVIRTSELRLASPLQGAQIFANQNHPLTSAELQTIPDTTCDNGSCSQGIATPWTSSLTYGFGYRCELGSNQGCDSTFSDPTSFKQFADAAANESFNQIRLSQQSNLITRAKIIYKVNISGTQPPGGYSNTITYIAIPNF